MGPLALGRRASARPCHSLRLTMALVCNDPLGGIWVGVCKRDGEELFFVQDTTHGVLCTMALSNAAIIPNSIPPSNIDLGSQARKKKIPDPIIKFLQVQRKNKHPEQLCFDFCRSFQTFSKAHRNQSVARSLGYTR